MTVILNIGNTYSRAALWNGSAFEFLPRIETVRLTSAALPAGMPVVAATVVPELKQRLTGADIRFIDSRHCGCLVDGNPGFADQGKPPLRHRSGKDGDV